MLTFSFLLIQVLLCNIDKIPDMVTGHTYDVMKGRSCNTIDLLVSSAIHNFSLFSRSSPAPAVTAASVTNTQASEVTVPQINSSESSGGKENGIACCFY